MRTRLIILMMVAEEIYECPLEFIPERWYSNPELIKHKNAFATFGLGMHTLLAPITKPPS